MMIDIGCGNHKVEGCVGVDIKKTSKVDILASVYNLPFKDKTFDKAYFYEVIEHLDNPKKALREIRRILKDNGILHLSTPSDTFIFRFLFQALGIKYKPCEEHIYLFGVPELKNILRYSGFKIKKIYYKTFIHEAGRLSRIATKLFFVPKKLRETSIIVEAVKDESFNGR